jgi:hypothetical protein
VSRGLGHVTGKLRRIFREGPPRLFSTTDLCRAVYGISPIEKKHRVAVLRALRILVARREVPIRRFIPKYEKADAEWFNPSRVGIPTHSRDLEPSNRSKQRAHSGRRR